MTREILARVQIHDEKDGCKVASIQGLNSPVTIFEDNVLDDLYVKWEKAKKHLQEPPDENNTSIPDLIDSLGEVLEFYSINRNKYYSGFGPEREQYLEEKEIVKTLEMLTKALDEIQNPKK